MPPMADSLVARHQDVGPLLTERAQRARLLEAMVQVVAEKGYAAATVADAVRRAKVSRGTFYALFESKQACLVAAYRLGTEVLEARIDEAVRDAADWREELRLGLRAYLRTLADEPRFARVFLVESEPLRAERAAAAVRFVARYRRSYERSGRPVPPDDAIFLLSAGVEELARARMHAGEDVKALEDTLVGCAVRLVTEEERWT
jgi:AcrR family transcriptional regulator